MKRFLLGLLFFSFASLSAGTSNFDSGIYAVARDLGFAEDDEHCDGVSVDRAFQPVKWGGTLVCFGYEKVRRDGLHFPDVIALHTKSSFGPSAKVHYFSGVANSGTIQDVFLLSIAPAAEDRLFVIYRDPNPNRWFSALYQVSVFQLKGEGLSRDESLSDFFGMGGDFSHDGLVHVFPYRSRKEIESSVNSALFRLATSSSEVIGTVQDKTYLYEEIPSADWNSITSSYLIKGDKVSVIDALAGWCNVIYSAGARPIKAWVKCESMIIN